MTEPEPMSPLEKANAPSTSQSPSISANRNALCIANGPGVASSHLGASRPFKEQATTATSPGNITLRDVGYVPLDTDRKFRNGAWVYEKARGPPPQDKFDSKDVFTDGLSSSCALIRLLIYTTDATTIQVVTFFPLEEKQTEWKKPLAYWTDEKQRPFWAEEADTMENIRDRLTTTEGSSWRWIHCEGLNGRALRAVAEATGQYQKYKIVLLTTCSLESIGFRWFIRL